MFIWLRDSKLDGMSAGPHHVGLCMGVCNSVCLRASVGEPALTRVCLCALGPRRGCPQAADRFYKRIFSGSGLQRLQRLQRISPGPVCQTRPPLSAEDPSSPQTAAPLSSVLSCQVCPSRRGAHGACPT